MDKYLTVSALNKYLKHKVDTDMNLHGIYLKGEISNLNSKHSSGNYFFTVKDENSAIAAIMYKSRTRNLQYELHEGDKVLIKATVSVYYYDGKNQLIVESIEPYGQGAQFLKFNELKNKLFKEGLFDESHKKPIPKTNSRIALLAGYPSAGLKDVVETVRLRFPFTQVYVFPIPVQGKNAAPRIIQVLNGVDKLNFPVIVLARGGGSKEDLTIFNDESIARAIYACKTPIVAGIGHEIDFSICDFVADLRAATPTAAAIAVTPDIKELKNNVDALSNRLHQAMCFKIEKSKKELERLKGFYLFKNPEKMYIDQIQYVEHLRVRLNDLMQAKIDNNKYRFQKNNQKFVSLNQLFIQKNRQRINYVSDALNKNMEYLINKKANELDKCMSQLDAYSPLKTLQRGYTIIQKDNHTLTSVNDVCHNDRISIKFKDGDVDAVIAKED